MALTACRQCGTAVEHLTDRCPQCGVYRPGRRPARTIGLLVGIVAVFGAAIAIGDAFGPRQTAAPRAAPAPAAPAHRYASLRDAQWDAYDGCRDEVLSQLKAPTQADVSGMDDSDPRWTGDVLTFRGTVDAPNPFGVKMRATWRCKLRVTLDRIVPLAFKLHDPMTD